MKSPCWMPYTAKVGNWGEGRRTGDHKSPVLKKAGVKIGSKDAARHSWEEKKEPLQSTGAEPHNGGEGCGASRLGLDPASAVV